MDAVDKIGDDIARSRMFSCENPSQGKVIALACLTTGRDILSVPEEYHLMNGKLTLQATAMLGRLVKHGGEYTIVDHSPTVCAITVKYKGREYKGSITWAEAQEEPFVYAGKSKEIMPVLLDPNGNRSKLTLSQNYATPRRRMQHLWARVVSDSVRVVAPDLVSGSYTPEEVADFSGLITDRAIDAVDWSRVEAATGGQAGVLSGPEMRALASRNEAQPSQTQTAVVETATDAQVESIESGLRYLQVPGEARAKIFNKRGVMSVNELSPEQADELIEFLTVKVAEKDAADKASAATAAQATSKTSTGETQARVDGPVTKELETRLRQKIKEVAQSTSQGREFTDKIKLKLDACGMKLGDMTYNDAFKLHECLEVMDIEAFFLHQLTIPEAGPTLHLDDEEKNVSGENPS